MDKEWKHLGSKILCEVWFRLYRHHFKHTLFKGGWSGTVDRKLMSRRDVAAVIPYDPVLDRVVLVEQFRLGAMHARDGPWLVEVVSGMIEEGEEPEEMVRREAAEEAGLTLTDLIPVRPNYASPGGTTEQVHIYCAY